MTSSIEETSASKRWLPSSPSFWLYASVLIAWAVSVAVLVMARWGVESHIVGPLMGAALGVALGNYFRQRSYWALTGDEREAVRRAQYSGTSTGSERLDRIAMKRLGREPTSRRFNLVMLSCFVTAYVVLAILALMSSSNWRTFVAASAGSGALALLMWWDWPADAQPNLRRLQDAAEAAGQQRPN